MPFVSKLSALLYTLIANPYTVSIHEIPSALTHCYGHLCKFPPFQQLTSNSCLDTAHIKQRGVGLHYSGMNIHCEPLSQMFTVEAQGQTRFM